MADNHLLVVAGDPSGDERAAEVITELQRLVPDVRLFGIGGPALAALGQEQLQTTDQVNIFGFLEALQGYFRLKKILKELVNEYQSRNAKGSLLVDFGGFNMRLAESLKNASGKTVYYISPQVWASRPERAARIAGSVDRLCVLFEFEKRFYADCGIDADHVGHPLLDSIPDAESPSSSALGDKAKKHLVIMPGSRMSELKRLTPVILKAVSNLKSLFELECTLIAAPGKEDWLLEHYSPEAFSHVDKDDKYKAMAEADCILMASGTAALEAALLRRPAVVIYKTGWLTGLIAKRVLKLDFVSLPNIIANEEVYPELLLEQCTPRAITGKVRQFLEDEEACARIQIPLRRVREELGHPGAAGRVARIINRAVFASE